MVGFELMGDIMHSVTCRIERIIRQEFQLSTLLQDDFRVVGCSAQDLCCFSSSDLCTELTHGLLHAALNSSDYAVTFRSKLETQ